VDERVLLVEDDPSIREIASLGLRDAGFRVTAAVDGREGLTRALHDAFDAIVLDVMLPSLDGFEVCREIRKLSRVPIVMLTARTDTLDVVVGLESGADDYVTKPFEMPELVARVRAVLRRAQAAPEETTLSVTSPSLPRSSSCSSSSPGGQGRSSPGRCCWTGCGTTTTWATPAWWMWPSSASGRSWRMTRLTRR